MENKEIIITGTKGDLNQTESLEEFFFKNPGVEGSNFEVQIPEEKELKWMSYEDSLKNAEWMDKKEKDIVNNYMSEGILPQIRRNSRERRITLITGAAGQRLFEEALRELWNKPQTDKLNELDPTSPEWLELYHKINNKNGK